MMMMLMMYSVNTPSAQPAYNLKALKAVAYKVFILWLWFLSLL